MRQLCAVALLLLLTGPPHEVLANPIPTPLAPTDDISFDDYAEAATRVMVTQEVLTFLVTAQSYWGQNQATLRGAMTGELLRDDRGQLIYSRNLANHGVLEGYDFHDGLLVRGQYLFLQRAINRLNEFIDYYAAVKQALSEWYGTPTQDQVLWENDMYQPLPDYWGVAVMIGYLRYAATWETPEGTITVTLTGDRHSKLTIDYHSHGFLEHDQVAALVPPFISMLESL